MRHKMIDPMLVHGLGDVQEGVLLARGTVIAVNGTIECTLILN